jgi:hypothetical protein
MAELQPHRSRYWLNAKPKDEAAFQKQVQEVCDCYLQARPLWQEEGIHTVCVDEKTGIQALERLHPTKPMQAGEVEKTEFEYKRHGTQCLIANFEVATGEVIEPTVQDTRTEQDFAEHIERTVGRDPQAGWIFVSDNLTTHCSATLVLLVALWCGLAQEGLGKKREEWRVEIGGEPQEILDGSKPPRSIRVCAEAHVLVESGGNLVQRIGAARDPAWELYLQGGSARQDPAFHRLLQQNAGQALQMDLHRPATQRVKPGKSLACWQID